MQLSPHFHIRELACRCGCGGEHAAEILANLTKVAIMLEKVRVALGNRPITITSGFRCRAHNARVGGARQSQHLSGRAVDIQVQGLTPAQVQQSVRALPDVHGIGEHPRFTHLDIRGSRVVFDYA
ncbi:DUF882 domain-containing protein [bacterium]|nr:DUF882 domain-containing protein [bacterium]